MCGGDEHSHDQSAFGRTGSSASAAGSAGCLVTVVSRSCCESEDGEGPVDIAACPAGGLGGVVPPGLVRGADGEVPSSAAMALVLIVCGRWRCLRGRGCRAASARTQWPAGRGRRPAMVSGPAWVAHAAASWPPSRQGVPRCLVRPGHAGRPAFARHPGPCPRAHSGRQVSWRGTARSSPDADLVMG